MQSILENLTIGVFAKAAGVNVETIRFYQRKVASVGARGFQFGKTQCGQVSTDS